MSLYAWQNRARRKPGQGFFDIAAEKYGEEAAEGPTAVLRIMLVFSMVSVFWALFDQHASTWVEQAHSMDRKMELPFYTARFFVESDLGLVKILPGYGFVALAGFGGVWLFLWVSNRKMSSTITKRYLGAVALCAVDSVVMDLLGAGGTAKMELQAAQIQALNPLMVMMIIAGLNALVYQPLKNAGRELRPLQKMTIGMFVEASAFVVAALLQERIEEAAKVGEQVPVMWQVIQYVMRTTSEVLISVTGLELAYTQAPRAMKSTIMGLWLPGVTFGNVLVAFLAPVQQVSSLSELFWLFSVLMVAASCAFAVMAKIV